MGQLTKIIARVDRDVCIGNAMCRALAPDVFKPTTGGQSMAVDSPVDPETAQEAADNCPVAAIDIEPVTVKQPGMEETSP